MTPAAELRCDGKERREQWVGFFRAGGELRLEQRSHEKGVAGKFRCPGLTVLRPRHDLHSGGSQLRLIFRIDLVVAEELFHHFIATVNPLQQGAGLQPDAGNGTTELGIGGAALGHGADYGRNDDVLGVGIMFGAVGVGELQNVAGTL